MRSVAGIPVLTWRPRAAIRRHGRTTPQSGERRYLIPRRLRWFLVHWVARVGYRVTAFGPPEWPPGQSHTLWSHEPTKPMLKRRQAPAEGAPSIPLESESVILNDAPLLRQFLTHTAYEDMTPRQPGYVTICTRGLAFEITLYDYDSGQRCACQGPTLDDMFAAAELVLGAENAPWTADNYLMGLLAKNSKKKK